MFNKITKFIKYNNGFVFILGFVFLFTGAVFAASPQAREVIVSKSEELVSVDNSVLLSADLDNFDLMMKVDGVFEKGEEYFVYYSYRTIALNEGGWLETEINGVLDVSKDFLGKNDLGVYVEEELGELLEFELGKLRQVQEKEREKGLSSKIASVKYSGLVGKFLDRKEKVFPAYNRVVVKPDIDFEEQNRQTVRPEIVLGCLDSTALNFNANAMGDDGSCQYSVTEPEPAPESTLEPETEPVATSTPSEPESDLGVEQPSEIVEPVATSTSPEPEPVAGCMDDTAENYNLEATEDDGSCIESEPEPEPVAEPEPEPEPTASTTPVE